MSWNHKVAPTIATYTAILMMVVMGLGRTAAAQTAQFSSEADAISGTVTKTFLGSLPTIMTISPVDQSKTVTSGSNDVPATSASQTAWGVEAYNFSTIDDSTSDSDTATLDGGGATASTGAGSLLGGLVKWSNTSDPLDCATDATVKGQTDCASTETVHGLTINGYPSRRRRIQRVLPSRCLGPLPILNAWPEQRRLAAP